MLRLRFQTSHIGGNERARNLLSDALENDFLVDNRATLRPFEGPRVPQHDLICPTYMCCQHIYVLPTQIYVLPTHICVANTCMCCQHISHHRHLGPVPHDRSPSSTPFVQYRSRELSTLCSYTVSFGIHDAWLKSSSRRVWRRTWASHPIPLHPRAQELQ